MPHSTEQQASERKTFVFPDMTKTYGDWRDDLFQEGYAIIPNVISAERSKEYVESMVCSDYIAEEGFSTSGWL